MKDTGFIVPHEKASRRARLYGFDEVGRLTPRLTGPGGSTMAERPEGMAYVSGGQGLWSTVDDYASFARMFAGAADGPRLLRPDTLKLMTTNCLTEAQRARSEVGGMPLFAAGHGFGMGLAVVLEPDQALPTVCGGGVGAVGWPGGFGGWWQADPGDDSVLVFLTHNLIERDQFARGIGFGVYDAITRFQALAAPSVR
jgi:CubicO group peptidase (beta-lactamase class C family)